MQGTKESSERERGVVVQETEEGQSKRQGSCVARDRREKSRDRGVVVQEKGES